MNDSDLIPGNENNTLYLAFKDANPCWLFVVNAIVKLLYVIPGIAANFAVILVTIRSKSLRSTANYLLAMNSLVEVFHQPGHFLSIWLALSSANFVSYPLAVNICSLPVFGLVSVAPILFFTGIDRLLAVSSLSFHERVNPALYLLTIMALCSAYSGYTLMLVYGNLDALETYQVTGIIGEIFQGQASQFYYTYTLLMNSVTIGIYIAVGLIIRYRSDQSQMRIFHSLVAIISLGIGGYLLMRLYTSFVVPNVHWSATTVWIGRQLVAIPLNISAGSNGPILYWTSVDYRKAFQAEWTLISAFFRRNILGKEDKNINKVQVLTTLNTTKVVPNSGTANSSHSRRREG